jgi:gentisate 1,2-dioxygenase
MSQKRENAPSTLGELNTSLEPLSFRAGWNKHEPSLWKEPQTSFLPASWQWERAKAALDVAGHLISAELAERRNLFMVNPVEGNYYSTVRTLVSAYQMILPGERARSHRHSPNALRLVIDVPEGAYTVVDGVRVDMMPGDVLLTPGNCWHGHGNEGNAPGYWIDFLDVPLVQLLEPMFFENWPEEFQKADTTDRPGSLVFDWQTTEKRLAAAVSDGDGRHRIVLEAPSMPTMELSMERLRTRNSSWSLRTTENQIVAIVSGHGRTIVGDRTIEWGPGDVVAIPTWSTFRHQGEDDAVILTVSDRPALDKLGFLRRQKVPIL